jgi:hypothetical protein
MNHPTLRTLVREDGADSEPALTLSAHEVLRAGRRSVRRRRAVAGLAGLATAAVVAATVVVVPGLSRDGSAPRLDAASRAALREYDATLMPALVDETVRQATRTPPAGRTWRRATRRRARPSATTRVGRSSRR